MNVSDDLMWRLVRREVHYVYRLFDSSDEIIYVGITSDVIQRWGQHRLDKSWWDEVMRKEVWGYASRDEAVAVEYALITSLQPRYNIASGASPTIMLSDDGTSIAPTRSVTPPFRSAPQTSAIYTWIHEQLDAGVNLTGADVSRQFPQVSRNGSRMVHKALSERTTREEANGEDEDPAETEGASKCEEDLEVHSAATEATQATAPDA